MLDVLLRSFPEYDYIVKTSESELPFNAGQDHLHGSTQYARCDAESERHTYEATETMMGYECGLILCPSFVRLQQLDKALMARMKSALVPELL